MPSFFVLHLVKEMDIISLILWKRMKLNETPDYQPGLDFDQNQRI